MALSFSTKKALSVDGIEYVSNCDLGLGSEVYYKISLIWSEYNASTSQAINIEYVDILPYVGDTGVLLYDQERLSEYEIGLSSKEVKAEILSGKTGEVKETTAFKVEYSSSVNPIRFNGYGEYVVGDGEWDNPENIEDIKALKITTDDTLFLDSSDTLSIIFKCKTPNKGVKGDTAYNSFALKLCVYDTVTGETTTMLPTEPPKVGVTLDFDEEALKREQSFIDLTQTIALQQTALSHVLNAEAEKMEKAIEISTGDEIIEVNQSVAEMINAITILEQLYLKFLDISK